MPPRRNALKPPARIIRRGSRLLRPAAIAPPVTLAWTAEGGTDQTDVTVANSGGASGDAWQTVQTGIGAIKRYSAAHTHSGSLGIEFATGSTATTPTVGWNTNIGTRTEIWYRLYLYFTAFPAASHRILHVHDAAGTVQRCSVEINSTGLLQMLDSAGSTLTADKTTTAIALNAWNRIEFHAILDPSVGQYEIRLYKTNPEAAIGSYDEQVSSAASKNLGGAGGTYRFGVTGTGVANVVSWWADDLSVSTGGWIGPTAGGGGQTIAAGQALETETAQTVGRLKTSATAQVTETETAQTVTASKTRAAGQALETETAQLIGRVKTILVGQAVETETAQVVTRQGAIIVAVGQAVETETAQPVGRVKTKAAAQAVETETGQLVGRLKARAALQATETETAQPATRLKTRAAAQAAETETGQAASVRKTRTVGQAVEVETGQPITRPGQIIVAVGQALETETAQLIGRVKLRTIAQAAETEAAQALARLKTRTISQALEAETAQVLAVVGGTPSPRWIEHSGGGRTLIDATGSGTKQVEGTSGGTAATEAAGGGIGQVEAGGAGTRIIEGSGGV